MNLINESLFCCVLLIFIMNIFGLFLWKIKKDIAITNAFQNILDELGHKTNKIWVDQGSGSITSWLEKNNIEIYSTHNEGKYVITETFIRTLMNKI